MSTRMPIYIGTILIEKNRWNPDQPPTIRVSEWLDRFKGAGFDGLELWEKHATLAPESELSAIACAPLPVSVYNTYAQFTKDAAPGRETAARMVRRFQPSGVKFNVGHGKAGPYEARAEINCAKAWADTLPENVRLLCECHAGTALEDPDNAARAFAEWDDPRFQAIVHPFTQDPQSLRAWFDRLGPRITHAHVQVPAADGGRARLDRRPDTARNTLRLMRDCGFAGSFTLEFTEGTSTPTESAEALFDAALHDLEFLRTELQ